MPALVSEKRLKDSELVVRGEQAEVRRIRGTDLVVRIPHGQDPRENVHKYYSHRLFNLIFPGKALAYAALTPDFLVSKFVRLDKDSLEFVRKFYSSPAEDRLSLRGPHFARSVGYLKGIMGKAQAAGFSVNRYPANVGFTEEGKPLLFEVELDSPQKFVKYVEGLPAKKRQEVARVYERLRVRFREAQQARSKR